MAGQAAALAPTRTRWRERRMREPVGTPRHDGNAARRECARQQSSPPRADRRKTSCSIVPAQVRDDPGARAHSRWVSPPGQATPEPMRSAPSADCSTSSPMRSPSPRPPCRRLRLTPSATNVFTVPSDVGGPVVATRHNRNRNTGRVALRNNPALLFVLPEPAHPKVPPPLAGTIDFSVTHSSQDTYARVRNRHPLLPSRPWKNPRI